MLNISKQLLSMNFFNQEQLDNFIFIYGKIIMVEKQQDTYKTKQQLLAKEVLSPNNRV